MQHLDYSFELFGHSASVECYAAWVNTQCVSVPPASSVAQTAPVPEPVVSRCNVRRFRRLREVRCDAGRRAAGNQHPGLLSHHIP